MTFLMKKLTAADDNGKDILTNEALVPSEEELQRCYETMGLMFASGRDAFLSVCEVPALVTWQIHEYDGMETIKW